MSLEHNWHEQRLLEDLAVPLARGDIEIIHDVTPFATHLSASYPVRMDRVDWSAIADVRWLAAPPGRANSNFQLTQPAAELRKFWNEIRRDNDINDKSSVIVLGDSLVNFVLRTSIVTMTEYMVEILSIPHHTYIFPDDASWCFNYTAEDEAFFAKRPASSET